MSDVVSQLEAVIAGICDRIDHTLECRQHAVALDMQGETPDCQCKRTARVRSEIARTVERMGNAMADLYEFQWDAPRAEAWTAALRAATSPHDSECGVCIAHGILCCDMCGVAFRATQEQETKK